MKTTKSKNAGALSDPRWRKYKDCAAIYLRDWDNQQRTRAYSRLINCITEANSQGGEIQESLSLMKGDVIGQALKLYNLNYLPLITLMHAYGQRLERPQRHDLKAFEECRALVLMIDMADPATVVMHSADETIEKIREIQEKVDAIRDAQLVKAAGELRRLRRGKKKGARGPLRKLLSEIIRTAKKNDEKLTARIALEKIKKRALYPKFPLEKIPNLATVKSSLCWINDVGMRSFLLLRFFA